MRSRMKGEDRRLALLLALGVLLLLASVAKAQAGASPGAMTFSAGYDLSWWTVDGGGVTLNSNGGYTLGGTIGQPDAGSMGESPTSPYCLSGGFWVGGGRIPTPPEYRIFLPIVMRNTSQD